MGIVIAVSKSASAHVQPQLLCTDLLSGLAAASGRTVPTQVICLVVGHVTGSKVTSQHLKATDTPVVG